MVCLRTGWPVSVYCGRHNRFDLQIPFQCGRTCTCLCKPILVIHLAWTLRKHETKLFSSTTFTCKVLLFSFLLIRKQNKDKNRNKTNKQANRKPAPVFEMFGTMHNDIRLPRSITNEPKHMSNVVVLVAR